MSTLATVSPAVVVETDTTDGTYAVGNGAFLMAVFGRAPPDTRPVVVSFEGDPAKAVAKRWFGRPWPAEPAEATDLPPNANNYFSLAVFNPDEAGQYRRQKARFSALHAVMLDDVGTKVALERLTLPPTWLIETSPGNHQAGYLLGEPLTDGATADCLMNAVVAAGLCDPGANGPRARLARLPVAVNGKHSPPFPCRLTEWRPELRYTIEELVAGLQLEMTPAGRPQRPKTRAALDRPFDGDPVWLPRPEENVVLATIRDRGLYKVPLGDGKHDITCPWVQDHTGAADGGTAYFEPDDSWPIGGFKCLHGHCAQRHVRDLLQFVGVEPGDARMKPTIRVVAGEMNRVVDAGERELAHSGRHYQRGGLIVTVVTDPGTRETRVQDISPPALVRALSGAATWERFDLRAEDWVRIDPPARHAAVLFDSTTYHHLPVLNGLTRQPYLRPDGSLMTAAGYDTATGMFGVFDAREFSVPVRPTRAQAVTTLALLKGLLTEFSFGSDTDLAAALVAMLTAVVRPSLAHAPMFHARAHMVGSGKSYLCELITAFATPQRGTPTTFPGDDEECRKLLLAELLRAPAVIEFDNLTGDLVAHKSLCTALTSEHMSGRILGVSKTATVNTRTLFLSSGNNVGPVQDMTRRCITIHLSPECEVPAARSFTRPDLVREVLRDRGRYVSAALTIVRAWILAGRPMTECKPLAGFGEWSAHCRQPLLWLGLPDPTASVFKAMADDPDRETLGRLLTAWQSAFGKTAAMVRDAVQRAAATPGGHAELREVLHDIADERGEINRQQAGLVDQAPCRPHRRRPAPGASQRQPLGGSLAGGVGFDGFIGSRDTHREKWRGGPEWRQRLRKRQPRRMSTEIEPPMRKRHPNPRLAKIHCNYTVDEVATLFGIHRNTVREWVKRGLPTSDGRRPMLILGRDLVAFLTARRAKNKRTCQPGQIYCVRCRAPREPAGDMVDYVPVTATLGNLAAICSACETMIYRRVSLAKLAHVCGKLDVTMPQALEHIGERAQPTVNSDLE